jgi:hypothetical protein
VKTIATLLVLLENTWWSFHNFSTNTTKVIEFRMTFIIENLLKFTKLVFFNHSKPLHDTNICLFISNEKVHGEFPIGHPIYPFIISILFALSHPKPYQVTFQILTYLDLTLMR